MRNQLTPNGERFILNSEIPPGVSFYGEEMNVNEAVGLSPKSRLFLEQQRCIGIPQVSPSEEEIMRAAPIFLPNYSSQQPSLALFNRDNDTQGEKDEKDYNELLIKTATLKL